MPPDSQCLMCAMKHVGMAMEALDELTYERDNRDFAQAHLRLAMEHTKLQWRDVAVRMRDATVMLDLVQDTKPGQMHAVLKAVMDELHRLYDIEHPEPARKLKELRDKIKVDVIIPLGNGSTHGNDELRLMLRSLEAHCSDVGTVYLATQYCPNWIDRDKVVVVDIADEEKNNKDKNLIDKVLKVVEMYGVKSFVFSADDNFIMRDVELKHLPLLYNRPRSAFDNADSKWRKRVRHTFDYFLERGVPLEHEFESHCPQYFADAQGLLKAMRNVDYATQPGLTIMTAFRAATGEIYGGRHMTEFKETYEQPTVEREFRNEKMFVGCNEVGFDCICHLLYRLFPNPSRYELKDPPKESAPVFDESKTYAFSAYTHNHLGDATIFAGAVRNVVAAHPDVRFIRPDRCSTAYENNPDFVDSADVVIDIGGPVDYGPLREEQAAAWGTTVQAFTRSLCARMEIPQVPCVTERPVIVLSDEELEEAKQWGDAILLNANCQTCSVSKGYPHWQAVVDGLKGCRVIQVGGAEDRDLSPDLKGVEDMRGRTTVRQLFAMAYGCRMVIAPPTSLTNIAGAFCKPQVVVNASREADVMTAYPNAVHVSARFEPCGRGVTDGCIALWWDRKRRCDHPIEIDGRKWSACQVAVDPQRIIDAALDILGR